jgi:hypothetical protein
MKVNVYKEEQTDEVRLIKQTAKTGADYIGISFILATPVELHYDTDDDDRPAVTFWGTNRDDLLKLLYRATEELEKSK